MQCHLVPAASLHDDSRGKLETPVVRLETLLLTSAFKSVTCLVEKTVNVQSFLSPCL